MGRRRGSRAGMLSVLALQLWILDGCSRGDAAIERKGEQAIPVVASVVEQRSVPLTVNVVGTVESIGSVNLQSRVDGQIVAVLVKDGEEVSAGQRLMQIDRAPYELQVRMAQATLARDEALLASAAAKEGHGQTLLKEHYIAADDYVQLKANNDSAAAIVEQDRAALDNAKLQLSYTMITAPVAGKIGHIVQQVGNTIHVSGQTVLTTLNVLDTVDVSFSLPEAELSPVRQAVSAAKTALSVSASPTGTPAHSSGDLTFIDNSADPATGTIRLRARFDNRQRVLWPGQLVDVSMNLPDAGQSLVIPDSAVSENSQGSYVFIVKDAIVEQRPIKVLRTAAEFAIVSGVQAGEQVVVDGQSRLTDKAHVQVRPDKAAA